MGLQEISESIRIGIYAKNKRKKQTVTINSKKTSINNIFEYFSDVTVHRDTCSDLYRLIWQSHLKWQER